MAMPFLHDTASGEVDGRILDSVSTLVLISYEILENQQHSPQLLYQYNRKMH